MNVGATPVEAADRVHAARTILVTAPSVWREESVRLAVAILEGPLDGDDTRVDQAWARYLRCLTDEQRVHLAEALEER